MKDLLRSTLKSLYANEVEILDMIDQLDLSMLNRKFQEEITLRIDEKTFNEVDSFLRSEKMALYEKAVYEATFACTQDLYLLMDFINSQQGEKH